MAEQIQISISDVMPTRPCRFSLCLQGGCVFADFDVSSDGLVYAVRVSFDGYGCCHSNEVTKMDPDDSHAILSMVRQGHIEDAAASDILRRYFRANQDVIWDDALTEHGLI